MPGRQAPFPLTLYIYIHLSLYVFLIICKQESVHKNFFYSLELDAESDHLENSLFFCMTMKEDMDDYLRQSDLQRHS